MDPDLFGDAGEIFRSLLPPELDDVRMRSHRYGLKVWFGTAQPGREHYEAQVIGARHVQEAEHLAVEVGFHAEHPKPDDNERVLDVLVAKEKRWRKVLGPEAQAAPFLGRDTWRRLSETWADVDLSDPELCEEIAVRLLDYVTALEPLRRA